MSKKPENKPYIPVYRKPDRRYENIDPRPLSLPIGMEKPESLQDKLARLVKDEVFNQTLQSNGIETIEDANDFDIPDEPEIPGTPHEDDFVSPGMKAREDSIRAGLTRAPTEEELEKAKEVINKWKSTRRTTDKKRRSDDKGDPK